MEQRAKYPVFANPFIIIVDIYTRRMLFLSCFCVLFVVYNHTIMQFVICQVVTAHVAHVYHCIALFIGPTFRCVLLPRLLLTSLRLKETFFGAWKSVDWNTHIVSLCCTLVHVSNAEQVHHSKHVVAVVVTGFVSRMWRKME